MPILVFLVIYSSCRVDFDYENSNGVLEFSRDTLYLDTIFTNIGSSTYTLKVYNRSTTDISIPNISLKNGANSKYRLNVEGMEGKQFTDIPLFAKDSLYIFIETTFDIGNVEGNEFLHTDAIQFDKENHLQEVQLVTLVKDAIFLYPQTTFTGQRETITLDVKESGEEIIVEGFELKPDQLNFTNDKPYVVFGYAIVPVGKTLNIGEGTRVFFYKDSGLLIKKNASINIKGKLSGNKDILENEVVFEGHRLEPSYADVPGQWGSLWISKGSTNNKIEYLTLKNATVGLFVQGYNTLDETTLTIKNSQIYNSENINLWARTAKIKAENLVLGGAGNISLYCNMGGDYNFLHATIANYWKNGFRTGGALQIDNSSNDAPNSSEPIKADFKNCIVYGSNSKELFIIKSGNKKFDYYFESCLIKFVPDSENELYDFNNSTRYKNILLNLDPIFTSPGKNNFLIEESSSAIGAGNLYTASTVPFDIFGIDRTENPDIGAIEAFFTN